MDTLQSLDFFDVVDALTESGHYRDESSDDDQNQSTKAPTLGNLAFNEACVDLEKTIIGERTAACFVCGGTVPTMSSVRLYWDTAEHAEYDKLVLPLDSKSTGEDGIKSLHQLVSDCEPASFGRGQQDVMDPEYRRAGKLDPSRFVSDFQPDEIVRRVEQYLVPNFSKNTEKQLPFRRLKAELYKLNVYSGPSGLFQKHVDTPRSQNQIGSLVVCLPSPFKGGNLVIRHAGKGVDFDWALESASIVQWAAFYSDCEHEIMTVTEGERITLTYNLFVVEPDSGSFLQSDIIDPTKMPLYGIMKDLISVPGFMKDGGVLGIYCSHAYPHTAYNAEQLLPRGLKGADLALYLAFMSLGLQVGVLPVLDNARFYARDHELKGEVVGTSLHPFIPGGEANEEGWESKLDVICEDWPSEELPGITWLGRPGHREEACSILTYGNQHATELVYSRASILAVIPPFLKRQNIIGALN